MFWEDFTDTSFVIIMIIGSVAALLFVYLRKAKKRRAR